MARSRGCWIGDEFQAQFFGAQGQLVHDSFAVAFHKIVLALIGVCLAPLVSIV